MMIGTKGAERSKEKMKFDYGKTVYQVSKQVYIHARARIHTHTRKRRRSCLILEGPVHIHTHAHTRNTHTRTHKHANAGGHAWFLKDLSRSTLVFKDCTRMAHAYEAFRALEGACIVAV